MRIVTAEAEWAQERIIARLAEFRGAVEPQPVAVGRHLASPVRTRAANAVVDLVAVAEAFCVNRLTSIRPVAHDRLSSWVKREKTWRNLAAVELSQYPDWRPFRGFVEVRNALAHGLGRLTDQQLIKYRDDTLALVTASGVARNGDAVLLVPADVERCGGLCQGLIEWLDVNAPQ